MCLHQLSGLLLDYVQKPGILCGNVKHAHTAFIVVCLLVPASYPLLIYKS